jgi:KRAB domain-containing zinc finger protein
VFCRVCLTPFLSRKLLKLHVQNEHKNMSECDICGVKNKSLTYIRQHVLIHRKIPDVYLCPSCGKSFKTNSSLTVHESTVHSSIKYPCEQCEKIFKTQQRLNFHVDMHHKKSTRFVQFNSMLLVSI